MAGIGSPRQCRSGIDEADQPCHTGPAPVPRCARVGLDTGMNLAVRTGVGPVSSAVSCSRSSTASRFPRHPPAEPHIPGASALALRAPSDAPESEPHETSQSRRAEQQSRRTAVRRRHPMSDSDRHSHVHTGAPRSSPASIIGRGPSIEDAWRFARDVRATHLLSLEFGRQSRGSRSHQLEDLACTAFGNAMFRCERAVINHISAAQFVRVPPIAGGP
ncbi:hypothetical protein QF025_002718 [Paraburkholderia graminis]|uniref:Uncharacterized protein n=1 Tax=Paraburkholderia graminis TaxID=60548 RepID=A0ABD5CG18_9BURK|nr:hypothetical protein [Paraburkholderia graminis]